MSETALSRHLRKIGRLGGIVKTKKKARAARKNLVKAREVKQQAQDNGEGQ